MKYRALGSSKLVVSEIALGSWLNTSEGDAKAKAIACVHRALDLGITLLDTANVYGRGAAERVLGEALAGVRRDSYVLATKLFYPMTRTDQGLSRAQIYKQLDASLSRLQLDHVDLYQCHRYDADTPLEETMTALSEVVRAGKVRYIGFSEWPVDRVKAALAIPGVEKFVSSQPQYSLLHQDPERALLPLCAENGISQIVWSPLAQGVLTGKYPPGGRLPPDSRAANDAINGFFNKAWLEPGVLQAVQALRPLAAEAGCSLTQFALAWVLRQPNVASAIVGASRLGQVDENAAASGLAIPAELFDQAQRIMASATGGAAVRDS
ncbi:MAG TPA: aldo/keto reductase family protein [Xanthobacteraceae bacterium]|jgi:aryl-alcohol dehydrogenase-like predicted oxidoreductase